MMITLLIPLRMRFALESHITRLHFENLGKMLLTMSLAGLPALAKPPLYDHRFTDDRFGVLVTWDLARAESLKEEQAQSPAQPWSG